MSLIMWETLKLMLKENGESGSYDEAFDVIIIHWVLQEILGHR